MHDGSGFPLGLIILVLVVGLAAAAWMTLAAMERARYRSEVEDAGLTLSRDGSPAPAYGLEQPPFGTGTERKVPLCISGQVARGAFRAFEYQTHDDEVDGLVLTLPLTHNFPPLTIAADDQVTCPDAAFAAAVVPRLLPTLPAIRSAMATEVVRSLRLTIDHETLVLLSAPREPEALKRVAEAASAAAAVLDDPALQVFTGTEVPAEMGMRDLPGWVYRAEDQAALDLVSYTRGGYRHRALDVVRAPGVIEVVRLTHTWDTDSTSTSTDANGNTTTHTTTQRHREQLVEYHPAFPFPALKVNEGWFGHRVQFESTDFNEQFTVRMDDARTASDVFHPRMMRWLLQLKPPPFTVRGDGAVEVDVDPADITSVAWGQWFVGQFFARVPDFVYENLGFAQRPIAAADQTEPANLGPGTPQRDSQGWDSPERHSGEPGSPEPGSPAAPQR